jgi:hypothetical protein
MRLSSSQLLSPILRVSDRNVQRLWAAVFITFLVCSLTACCKGSNNKATKLSLKEFRSQFKTKLTGDPRGIELTEPPVPPSGTFERVKYPSKIGALWAYVTPKPESDKKLPAIVWVHGGFSSSIGESSFTKAEPTNDQSSAAFREAGIVLMIPSFRGGNNNPGKFEELYGEVDDCLAAIAYTKKLSYVDPERVYLGGHSTGGTLVLLATEVGPNVRAVFSFGPKTTVVDYGTDIVPFDLKYESASDEWRARSPIIFMKNIQTPTFVFEGRSSPNALDAGTIGTKALELKIPLHSYVIPWGDHFTVLRPISELIAKKIKADTGPKTNISFSGQEIMSAKPERE